jgi:hypothetical protein
MKNMDMTEWFRLPEATRRQVFIQVGEREGLPAAAVEKDWWVTFALRVIFSLPVAPHLVFKGGTSLSKGWDLIKRFSEDIDLAIDRAYLGFDGELSKGQVRRLRKASHLFIAGNFHDQLRRRLQELGIEGIRLALSPASDSDTDPTVVEWYYPALTEPSPYLLPRILVEIGARSLREPFEHRPILSMVDAQFEGHPFTQPAADIPTVLPKRTFLEKAFLLHEEFQKPEGRVRVDRLSRHLYDLEKLMDTDHGLAACQDRKLYDSIVRHRASMNAVRGLDYGRHAPETLAFIPPAALEEQWASDYATMRENMIYGESLDFQEVISRMRTLQERFRALGMPPEGTIGVT